MRIWVVAALALLAGCSSYQSELFTETSPGQYQRTHFNGVPVVVTVPQKLGFLVTETTYEVSTPVIGADGTTGAPLLSYVVESTIDRTPISLGESKLVGLDIKRPMFGTAKTGMDLANQYPTKLSSDVDDKTLGTVLDALEKTLANGNTVEKQGEQVGAGAVTKRAVKQVQYLLIYDPRTGALSRAKPLQL